MEIQNPKLKINSDTLFSNANKQLIEYYYTFHFYFNNIKYIPNTCISIHVSKIKHLAVSIFKNYDKQYKVLKLIQKSIIILRSTPDHLFQLTLFQVEYDLNILFRDFIGLPPLLPIALLNPLDTNVFLSFESLHLNQISNNKCDNIQCKQQDIGDVVYRPPNIFELFFSALVNKNKIVNLVSEKINATVLLKMMQKFAPKNLYFEDINATNFGLNMSRFLLKQNLAIKTSNRNGRHYHIHYKNLYQYLSKNNLYDDEINL